MRGGAGLPAAAAILAGGLSAAVATSGSLKGQAVCFLVALAAAPLVGLSAAWRRWLSPLVWVAACAAVAGLGWLPPLVGVRLAVCGLGGIAIWLAAVLRRPPPVQALLATLGAAVLVADGSIGPRLGQGEFAGAAVALATMVRLAMSGFLVGLAFRRGEEEDEAMARIAALLARPTPAPDPGAVPSSLREIASAVAGIRERLAQERDRASGVRDRISEVAQRVMKEGARFQSGAAEQVGSLSETSVTSEELLESSRQVGDRVREVALVADASLESARGGVQAAQAFSGTVGALGEACRTVADRMFHLRESVQRLATALGALFRATSKADMLALSAELEASKAEGGEARFLSVATQMRQLGEVVTRSMEEIGPVLQEIRQVARATARATDLGVSATSRGFSLSSSLAERLAAIAGMAAATVESIQEIAPLVELQIHRTVELDQSLTRLADATRSRAAASTPMLAAGRALQDITGAGAPARES